LGSQDSRLERGALWDQVVPPELGDVVEREAAPEGAEGSAGGGILVDAGEHLGEGL
jgi:hypothetical protein